MAYDLKCAICNTNFKHSQKHTLTCSVECRNKRNSLLAGIYRPDGNALPTNFVGKLHEVLVCADLGIKGYDVYYSFFPQQKYDLIARKRSDGKLLIIDVKTGYRSISGKVSNPNHRHPDWDMIAVVIRSENSINYFDRNGNPTQV